MGKRRLTPKKRVGRPKKNRIKVANANEKHVYISNEDRMTIALLAKKGHSPADIATALGCNYKTAVKYTWFESFISVVRSVGVIGQRRFFRKVLSPQGKNLDEHQFSTPPQSRRNF